MSSPEPMSREAAYAELARQERSYIERVFGEGDFTDDEMRGARSRTKRLRSYIVSRGWELPPVQKRQVV